MAHLPLELLLAHDDLQLVFDVLQLEGVLQVGVGALLLAFLGEVLDQELGELAVVLQQFPVTGYILQVTCCRLHIAGHRFELSEQICTVKEEYSWLYRL